MQNEISEVFDKLQVDDDRNVEQPAEPITASIKCCNSDSSEAKTVERASLGELKNGATADEWNSLAQFEKLIKMEMENLANTPTETSKKVNAWTKVKSNILKPEKHVSKS